MNDTPWVGKAVAAGIAVPAVIAALAWAGLAGTDGQTEPLPTYWDAPRFALVDQMGDTLRSEELLGGPWVGSFVFTNCAGVCPLITARMAQLRDSLETRGRLGEVRLVSFTVDPARDTPPVLRAYAERFGGPSPDVWAFLTGSPPEAVRALIQEGFRLTAVAPQAQDPDTASSAGDYQVSHSPRVVLVDGRGAVRGIYDGTEAGTPSRILADIGRLRSTRTRAGGPR